MAIISESRSQALVQVLSDIATDLASIQDIDAVFLAIVQRTRAITGSDMAYLSLNDHDKGETYIRKSDGVRTQEYRTIRMPLGTGVLGKAATGVATVTSSEYVEDETLVHLPEIDEIVRKEGVRSILGRPMTVHGKLQGALLIADRSSVTYPPDTIALVDAIARQAAVAIHYTAQLQEVTDALSALDAKNDAGLARVNALQSVFQHDRKMVETVASRGGPDAVLALLSELYHAPVDFLGAEGVPGDMQLTRALQVAAAGGRSAPIITADGPATVAAAEIGKRRLGYVMVRENLPPENRELLEHGALYVAMAALIDRFEAEAEHRTKRELLDDLVRAGSVASSALRGRLVQTGLSTRQPLSMLVIGGGSSWVEVARRLRGELPRPIIATHGDHLCVLHQGEPLGELAHALLNTASAPVQVGTARVRDLNVAQAHRSAELALANLRMLGGSVLDGNSLGALGVLLEAEGAGTLAESVFAPAQPLLELARGAELARTAWAFLEFGPRVSEVAERLFIHPNTLRQRIARISAALGEQWHSGPGKLDLHLALRAFVLRQTLNEDRER